MLKTDANNVYEENEVIRGNSSVSDYFKLLKPRVMLLAVFTSVCGLILSPNSIHPFFFIISVICISLGAGASGAINMWYDKDIDALMDRTKQRPIPMGKIDGFDALGFGVILSIISVVLLGLAVNYFAAFLLACSISFYIFIYTMWLKRKTPHNIVIGGAAGAFPPIIGWACVSGDISLYPILLFTLIFFWTPPHFWALSLYKDIEYSKANVPMLPVVSGRRYTKNQIFIYSIILFMVSLLPFLLNYTGLTFMLVSLILNSYFLILSYKLLISQNKQTLLYASKLFKYSIFYLYLIFLALVIDSFVH